jgi:hypothetical protein
MPGASARTPRGHVRLSSMDWGKRTLGLQTEDGHSGMTFKSHFEITTPTLFNNPCLRRLDNRWIEEPSTR